MYMCPSVLDVLHERYKICAVRLASGARIKCTLPSPHLTRLPVAYATNAL